MPFQARNGSCS